jgi:hypothetical protein
MKLGFLLGLPLFLSEVFLFELLAFWGCLFFIGGLYFNPLHFLVASFFIGGLSF